MAEDLLVPSAPPLSSVPNVELMHTGTWDISTGTFTFTTEDFYSAVGAMDCPAVRRPILKLGHTDPRFNGEPAVGWIANLGVAEAGRTLVGDYVGMPGWMGDVIASAYPDRSIEGEYDFRCQMGHTHPFVLTAVALLGVTAPGIGTLASLQDVATLYGVVAASSNPKSATGTPVTVLVSDDQEVDVPNPRPLQVAATVSSEDVRRAYYAENPSWDIWIEEMQLDPQLQLIVINDATGDRTRVPVVVGDGDGEDAVSFADPVTVIIRYEDAPSGSPAAVAAAAGSARQLVWASRAESRPGAPAASDTPQTPAQPPGNPNPNPEGADTMSDTLSQGLRERLGVTAELDDEALLDLVDEALTAPNTPAAPTPGTVTLDEAQHADLVAAAEQGREARTQQLTEQRERLVTAAVTDGRIAPARRDHWLQMLETDPGSSDVLASLKPGLVPVAEIGTGQEPTSQADSAYAGLYGNDETKG